MSVPRMHRAVEGICMIKRQQRIERIAAVAREYVAAKSAAGLLAAQLQTDPNYGRYQGWEARDGAAFIANLDRLT